MKMKFNVPLARALDELTFQLAMLCPSDCGKGAAPPDGVELLSDDPFNGAPAVEVMCDFSEGEPASMYAYNGDPGDPGEPAELELHSVACASPLRLKHGGFSLYVEAGTDLLPLLSPAGVEHLADTLYPLAAAALAGDRDEALVERAIARKEELALA